MEKFQSIQLVEKDELKVLEEEALFEDNISAYDSSRFALVCHQVKEKGKLSTRNLNYSLNHPYYPIFKYLKHRNCRINDPEIIRFVNNSTPDKAFLIKILSKIKFYRLNKLYFGFEKMPQSTQALNLIPKSLYKLIPAVTNRIDFEKIKIPSRSIQKIFNSTGSIGCLCFQFCILLPDGLKLSPTKVFRIKKIYFDSCNTFLCEKGQEFITVLPLLLQAMKDTSLNFSECKIDMNCDCSEEQIRDIFWNIPDLKIRLMGFSLQTGEKFVI
ncbi:unnamed protein product [Moneuplotes crassus]|uniref:Uncharacterized protein n=1 Tax=Euplotes crassus TaxID=5936 RepID=A0AAD1XK56_EUPCR|nr:unnamed protein product [Moneuplotes crassus]